MLPGSTKLLQRLLPHYSAICRLKPHHADASLLHRYGGRSSSSVAACPDTEVPQEAGLKRRRCNLYSLGCVEYETAWAWQQELLRERFQDEKKDDVLLMLEHSPVYTMGRRASMDHVKFDPNCQDFKLIRVDRGGETTYHGPGQLVAYPILDLRHYKKDLHWYMRQVEEVVIISLGSFGLEAKRIAGLTGVWVGDKKVAAIGTHASKWITMHGFALNVQTDLTAFDRIVPCGISDREVASMNMWIPDITMEAVRVEVADAFQTVFGCELVAVGGHPTTQEPLPIREDS